MATFAERLCEALLARNMSAAELSRALGINEGTVSQYKKGLYEPKQKRTQEIARILNVSIAWLMGADIPMRPYEFPLTVNSNKKSTQIPVLGRVAAGYPIEAVENIIDYEEIQRFFIELLGGVGVIAYYIIKIAVVGLPFVFINVPIWATLIIIVVVYFIPYLTPVVWLWGLISAITSPQYWFSYVFYVVFALCVIMFVISLFRKN